MEKRLEVRVQAELLERFDKACEDNFATRSEVLRQAMVSYVRQNQKEREDSKMNWTEVMNKARELANSGTFTDNPEEADGTTYLVADMDLVVKAFAKDIEEGKLGAYSEPEKFLTAHGIEWK